MASEDTFIIIFIIKDVYSKFNYVLTHYRIRQRIKTQELLWKIRITGWIWIQLNSTLRITKNVSEKSSCAWTYVFH
jgi:hypothetical protein